MTEHLEALRRDLERPGKAGLYLAGIAAALTAMVREHPELAPLIARQAEQWHEALALTPETETPTRRRFRPAARENS